jgi:hypothetical protein
MFYEFNQNNSGGHFEFDEDDGITHFVIIEADSLEDCLKRAAFIGIYFDGCREGIDCSCCGDRWYEPWKEDGKEQPEIYGEHPKIYAAKDGLKWMEKGKEVCIHYKDGTREWY